MNLYFDRRLRRFVTTPGLDDALDSLEFKAGDTEEIVIQFGTSPEASSPSSVITAPQWTAESLSAGATISIGIKASGDYHDGDLLSGTSSFTEDTVAKTYTFDLSLNTTEINTALNRDDSDDTNDTAAIENALFEMTYKASPTAGVQSSIDDIDVTIKHDVLSGSEGTPASAATPSDYALTSDTIEFLPAVNSQTGGTAADLDSVATTSRTVGEGVAFFDDDASSTFRVYELVSGTDAESAPDTIRPDDYAASTNEKVWKLRNGSAGGALTDVVDDTSPQLGGNLDVNGNSIVSASNGDIDISPDGTGKITIGKNLDVGSSSIVSSSNADINITPDGTGDVTLGNLTFDADQTVGAGQDDYVLTYDNAGGKISLEAAAGGGGGMSDLVDDTSPQLGGDLDANGNAIFESKGTNITAASALTPSFDGNYYIVSGSTSINSIATSGVVGTEITLYFSEAVTVNHSTDIDLPDGENITMAAGDHCVFREYQSGDWRLVSFMGGDGRTLGPCGGGTFPVDTFDFTQSTLRLPNLSVPVLSANGHIAVDTSVTDFSAGVLKYYGSEEMACVAMPIAELVSPSDGSVPTYNATNDEFELVAGSGGDLALLSTATASSDAQIDFTTSSWFDGTYPGGLLIKCINLVPATDNVALQARVSISSTFQTGSSYHHSRYSTDSSPGAGATGASGATAMVFISGVGSDTGEGLNADILLPDCSNTALYKTIRCNSGWINTAGNFNYTISGGMWKGATSAIDGFRLFFSSGNIESGTIKLYGIS